MDWKRIIVAIDNTQMSVNAVNYVGSLVGKLSGVRLCLLHIYPAPPPDYYREGATLDEYKHDQTAQARQFLRKAAQHLRDGGVPPESIWTRCVMADNQTISEAILSLQQEENYGTIVVGKRGISKSEEFLFGSISSALIHNGRNIAVWVVG